MANKTNNWLSRSDTHQKWIDSYYNPQNSRFYESAFNFVAEALDAPKNALILDAGCGPCYHSIRLARRNFTVLATDFSDVVLEIARENVKKERLTDKIKIEKQDLCSMSFGNETFDYVICWGVLMHIPKIEDAIKELIRVMRPGAKLVISEGNSQSLEKIILMIGKRMLQRQSGIITPAGREFYNKESGAFVRATNIAWLILEFQKLGCTLVERHAGQFTEFYVLVQKGPLYTLIQSLNSFWFNQIKSPYLATGNILIFEKR